MISHISVAIHLLKNVIKELMSKRNWEKRCLKANIVQPEDIVRCGTVKVAKIEA